MNRFLNDQTQSATLGSASVYLTKAEYAIFRLLAYAQCSGVSYDDIETAFADMQLVSNANCIRSHLKNLRAKLALCGKIEFCSSTKRYFLKTDY